MRLKALNLFAFVLVLLCTGCQVLGEARDILTAGRGRSYALNPQSGGVSADNAVEGFNYTLLIEKEGVSLSMYEPETGCYLGASVQQDTRTGGDMKAFDELTGTKHAITGISVCLGDELPESEILQCIAQRKIPLITINPPEVSNPYDEVLLQKTAASLGKYNVPIFVEFYPCADNSMYNAESYKRFFRKVWQALREKASSAALVWSADLWDGLDALDYYPGDSYVEWVGVRVTADITASGYGDFIAFLDAFSDHFQESKPIIITSLSISHFTTLDNTYYTTQCAGALTELYENIAYRWPRVKAVVYNSRNALDGITAANANSKPRNNYLITDEDLLIDAYAAAATAPAFLSSISSGTSVKCSQFMKSSENAALRNKAYYIPVKSLPSGVSSGSTTDILGERCYSINTLSGSFTVDGDKKIIYLSLNQAK